MTNSLLKQVFKNDREVLHAYVSMKKRNNNTTKFGFIRFGKKREAENSMKRNNGLLIRGSSMVIQCPSI